MKQRLSTAAWRYVFWRAQNDFKEKEISTLKRIRFHLGVCSALCLVPVALCLVALLLEAGII